MEQGRVTTRYSIDGTPALRYGPTMRERATDIARAGIRAISEFFGWLGREIADWVRGDDVTALVVLGIVALFVLFVVVPSHRRY